MIRNTSHKVLWPTLGAALLGVTLAGCGGNNAAENTTGGTATSQTTETTTSETTTSTGSEAARSEAPAELTAFFPGATLTKKAFPMDADAAAHMSEGSGVKFTGDEKEWEVYEASQNGARSGYAVMTHLSASSGDTHVVFAVDKNFKITNADAMDAPKMKPLVAQAVGKNHDAKWKVGQDFKPVTGLSQADAQAAVDALHKGVLILEENFNPNHGDHTHSATTSGGNSAGNTAAHGTAGHKDDGHAH